MDLKMMDTAKEIISAVIENNWAAMLTHFPDGIEYRGDIYNEPRSFTDWDTFDEFARYIAPARDMMVEKCLRYVKQILE